MANPSMTNEELQLKQRARRRLIGAVTLVTGLVVFLPMVLDNEPKPVSEDIAINIPSQDGNVAKAGAGVVGKIGVPEIAAPQIVVPKSAVLASSVAPPASAVNPEPPAIHPAAPPVQHLTVPPGGQPKPMEPPKPEKAVAPAEELVKEAAKPMVAVPTPHQEPQPVKPVAPKEIMPEASQQATEKPKQSAKPAETGAPAQGGFVVRLGAFTKPENAKQLKAKVSAMGIRNYSAILKTASGDKTLVRAGPYATRKEAEAARDRLKAANVDGDVVAK